MLYQVGVPLPIKGKGVSFLKLSHCIFLSIQAAKGQAALWWFPKSESDLSISMSKLIDIEARPSIVWLSVVGVGSLSARSLALDHLVLKPDHPA